MLELGNEPCAYGERGRCETVLKGRAAQGAYQSGGPFSACWITVSPYWYMRGQGPQTALSDVGGPTERQASARVFPMVTRRRCTVLRPMRLAGALKILSY